VMTPNPLLFYFDDRGSFFEKCPLMVSKNGATALGKTTLNIKTLSIPIKMALSITTLKITTSSTMILSVMTLDSECFNDECSFFIVMVVFPRIANICLYSVLFKNLLVYRYSCLTCSINGE
jgi:hypothetical protein